MKLEFGNGNIFVTTYGDKDVNYGVAFRIVPEIDHPTHKCIGFAFEADKILGGIYMPDKERAQRLEAMIDRMSETIVELRRQLFFSSEETQKYRERVENFEKMITNKA